MYWARWGDAVREAGLEPNIKQAKHDEDFLLTKLAEACQSLDKYPTEPELRMYGRQHADFPYLKSFRRHYGSLAGTQARLAEWISDKPEYADIGKMLSVLAETQTKSTSTAASDGWVYLIKSGIHYKIGRSDNLEQRVKGIRIALPESATLVHSIRTDDPPGIEAYWHRRFADRRANGEWFTLTRADLAAFKKRRYQ